VGPAHSHAKPQTLPCPRACNATAPQRHSRTFRLLAPSTPSRLRRKRRGRAPDVPKVQSIGAPRRLAAGPPERHRKARHGSIPRKIPNPSHAAGRSPLPSRGPCPLPCRAADAPLPASPRHPELSRNQRPPAFPRHHSEPKRKQPPKARHGCAEDTAGKRRKAQPD